jgi:hypothetical protein
MITRIQTFIDCYQQLNKDNLTSLEKVYHPDIHFQDPAYSLEGIKALLNYFEHLYQDIEDCKFAVQSSHSHEDQAFLNWQMTVKHRRLRNPVVVEGISQLTFSDNRVIFHRDYFDLGELVYEQLPVLGKLVSYIKQRLIPKEQHHA